MRTTVTVKRTTEEQRVEKIVCNMCGKLAKHVDCTDINDIDISFGYGSIHDTETWSFDLCDKCVEDVVSKFQLPPTIIGG